MLMVKKTTQVFTYAAHPKLPQRIFDNFVYKLGKICCCQPTAASSQSPCYDALTQTCLSNWWEPGVCLLQRKSPIKGGVGVE